MFSSTNNPDKIQVFVETEDLLRIIKLMAIYVKTRSKQEGSVSPGLQHFAKILREFTHDAGHSPMLMWSLKLKAYEELAHLITDALNAFQELENKKEKPINYTRWCGVFLNELRNIK